MNRDAKNSDTGPIDEVTMMRLVDGELAADERISVLRRLESHPNGWRDCALAFLEDQAWKQVVTSPVSATTVQTSTPLSISNSVNTANSTGPTKASANRSSQTSGRSFAPWLGLAAAVLAAFFLGNQFNSPFNSNGNSGSNNDPNSSVAVDDGRDGFDRGIENQVANAPNDAGEFAADGTSPLYVLDRDFWKHESSVPRDFQEKLKSLGARIERGRGVMPIRSGDGRQWIVPYEEVEIVPVNNVSM